MFRTILLLIVVLFYTAAYAQVRIVVTTPSTGISKVVSTLDSAILVASDGDNIYLPGGTFSNQLVINKKVYIYGVGHAPDSTSATNRTIISSAVIISTGVKGGLLEGIETPTINFQGATTTSERIENFIIKRCRITGNLIVANLVSGGYSPADQYKTTNSFFVENIIGTIYNGGINNNFTKNIIYGDVGSGTGSVTNSTFNNNCFLYTANYFLHATNSLFNNNIFLTTSTLEFYGPPSTNIFKNNLIAGNNGIINTLSNSGNLSGIAASSFFISNSNSSDINAVYTQNFHLAATCAGRNAGTDGTDVGIYGTSQPTKEGWVPSNPHISSKNISTQTTTNGILQVIFNVKAQTY